jgi:hypothetical protein
MPGADARLCRPLQDGLLAAGPYLDRQARRLVSLAAIGDGLVITLASRDPHGAEDTFLPSYDASSVAVRPRGPQRPRGAADAPCSALPYPLRGGPARAWSRRFPARLAGAAAGAQRMKCRVLKWGPIRYV